MVWEHLPIGLSIYVFIVFPMLLKGRSLEKSVFCLLMFISRQHQSFVLFIYFLLFQLIPTDDHRIVFLFIQSSFFSFGLSSLSFQSKQLDNVFFKGNSNSFVTIDISTGFVGLSSYNAFLHGLLIYLGTYGLSIIWMSKLPLLEVNRLIRRILLLNTIFLFSFTFHRHHLFLWTVFAPKLLYLLSQTLTLIFIGISFILFNWSKRQRQIHWLFLFNWITFNQRK